MSDQANKPTDAGKKPSAKSDGKGDGKGDFALPKSQQLSTTQHILIWALVIVVGVLFGMGSTVDILGNSGRGDIGSVSEHEILTRQHVARRLQNILNPNRDRRGEQFEPMSQQQGAHEMWADRIKLGRMAEAQGLMPGGEALDAIVKDFLNRPLLGNPQKKYVDAIQEAQNGDNKISLEELRRHLAEDRARQLLSAANVVVPAVPINMADAIAAMPPLSQMDYYMQKKGDQVVVDEVILSAKHLLPEIKDDDPEIALVYDRLKGSKFSRPAALVTTIAHVDVPALAATIVVPDSDIEAHYNANKEEFRKPVELPKPDEKKVDAEGKPVPPEPPKVEYKALAEVSAEIKQKLAKERAELKAKEMVKKFDAAAEEVLNDKDNKGFIALATKMGLKARDNVLIEEPRSGGTLDAGDFGMLSETQLHLFNQEMNAVTSSVQSTGEKAAWLVIRIDGRKEAGFKELTDPEVKKEVINVLRGERAYKDFIVKAQEIRAAIEKMGPGGLKKWAASDDAKVWNATITTNTISALQPVAAPPAELNIIAAEEPKLLAAMAMPDRPVALGTSPEQDGVPAVRLVQVTDYQPAMPAVGDQRIQHATTYRAMLESYRYGIFYNQMTTELRDN